MPKRPERPDLVTFLRSLDGRVRQVERHKHPVGDHVADSDCIRRIGDGSQEDPFRFVIDPACMSSGSGREYATVVVAADDTHPDGKANANFVCDGVNDQDTINAAIASLPSGLFNGGEVVLLEGQYNLSDQIDVGQHSTHLRGMGPSTFINAVGLTTVGDAAIRILVQRVKVSSLRIVGAALVSHGILVATSGDDVDRAQVINCLIEQCIDGVRCIGQTDVISCLFRSNNTDVEDFPGTITRGSLIQGCSSTGANTFVASADPNNTVVAHNRIALRSGASVGISNVAVSIGNHLTFLPLGGVGIRPEDGGIVMGNTILNSDGVGIEADSGSNTQGVIAQNLVIVSSGIGITGSASTRIVNNHVIGGTTGIVGAIVEGNHVEGTSGDAIRTAGGTTEFAPIITNNIVGLIFSTGGVGIRVIADASLVSNNTVGPTGEDGIVIEANDCTIHDNRIRDASQDLTVSFDGIRITGTASRNSVQGNQIRRNGIVIPSVPTQRFGINVDNALATLNLVTNNDLLFSGGVASFNDAGTGTVTAAGNRL